MALCMVILAHAGAWYGLSHLRATTPPPGPLPVIEVALLAPPPKIVTQPSEPPKPEPKRNIRHRAKPVPVPMPLPLQPEAAQRPLAMPLAPAPAAPAAPPPPAMSAPEPILEAPRFNATYLNNPPPDYPPSARRRGIEGKVLVRAEIQIDGSCSRVELKSGSGSDMLNQAALDAVKKWRFVPAHKGTQPLTAWVEVPITFKLEN